MPLILAAIVVGAGALVHIHATRVSRARIDAGIIPQPPYEQPTAGVLLHGVTGGPVTRGRNLSGPFA